MCLERRLVGRGLGSALICYGMLCKLCRACLFSSRGDIKQPPLLVHSPRRAWPHRAGWAQQGQGPSNHPSPCLSMPPRHRVWALFGVSRLSSVLIEVSGNRKNEQEDVSALSQARRTDRFLPGHRKGGKPAMFQVLLLSQGSGAAEETIANQTSTGHPGHSTCGTDTATRLVHINPLPLLPAPSGHGAERPRSTTA